MSRCKWCGEPEASAHVWKCGSNLVRQSGRCKRLVDPERGPKKKKADVNVGGRPRGELREQLDAVAIGETHVVYGYKKDSVEHIRQLWVYQDKNRRLVVRAQDDGTHIIHVVPDISKMEVGDFVLYSDDLGHVSQMVAYRNQRWRMGVAAEAYCYDLVGDRYWLRRVR
jgi:hypothetical protein